MQVLACAPAQVRDSFSHYEGESPPRLGYRAIRGDQRKRLMGTAFPLADPSISGQLPGSRVIGNYEFQSPPGCRELLFCVSLMHHLDYILGPPMLGSVFLALGWPYARMAGGGRRPNPVQRKMLFLRVYLCVGYGIFDGHSISPRMASKVGTGTDCCLGRGRRIYCLVAHSATKKATC